MNRPEEQRLEHIIKRMTADRSEDAPAAALKYAKDLFRVRAAEAQPSFARRVLAALQIDLAPNVAAFGERSAAGAEARQMLFDAEESAVDLRVTSAGDKFDLRGQVLGSSFENGEARLTGASGEIGVQIGPDGGFSFSGLAAGDHSLSLTSEASEIVIEKFTL
jgi:hypothetical protein